MLVAEVSWAFFEASPIDSILLPPLGRLDWVWDADRLTDWPRDLVSAHAQLSLFRVESLSGLGTIPTSFCVGLVLLIFPVQSQYSLEVQRNTMTTAIVCHARNELSELLGRRNVSFGVILVGAF